MQHCLFIFFFYLLTTCRCIFQKSLQNRIPDFLSISISFTQFGIVGRVPLLLHVFSYQFRAVFPFEIELCHDRPTGVRNCCYCCHITTGAIVKTIHVTCPLRSVSVWLRCCFSFSCILYLSPFHFVLSLSLALHMRFHFRFFLLLCNFISYIRQVVVVVEIFANSLAAGPKAKHQFDQLGASL